MITKFNIFESKKKPDLRRMSEYVKCIKCIRDISEKKNNFIFKKDQIYKITCMWGDPESAIEKYGINNYLPIECISGVEIFDDNGEPHFFVVSLNRHPYFFDYFQIMEEALSAKNYNL